MSDPFIQKIDNVLDRIRPAVQADGGNVVIKEFDVSTGTLYLYLQGSCSGCPSSQITLKNGIENYLRDQVPEVKKVEAVNV